VSRVLNSDASESGIVGKSYADGIKVIFNRIVFIPIRKLTFVKFGDREGIRNGRSGLYFEIDGKCPTQFVGLVSGMDVFNFHTVA